MSHLITSNKIAIYFSRHSPTEMGSRTKTWDFLFEFMDFDSQPDWGRQLPSMPLSLTNPTCGQNVQLCTLYFSPHCQEQRFSNPRLSDSAASHTCGKARSSSAVPTRPSVRKRRWAGALQLPPLLAASDSGLRPLRVESTA